MDKNEIVSKLAALGDSTIKRIYLNHGAQEPFFGVKIGDMKPLQKVIKKNHQLSLELYDTGISDAMYFAGLIADEKKITADELRHWAENARWYMHSEYTVAWVAAESAHGWPLALEWIESEEESMATAGWSTLASLVTIKKDEELDLDFLEKLIVRVEKDIHAAPNRVRYVMNGFLIAVGCHVVPLSARAKEAARKVGKVSVDMGGTACKVPDAVTYIEKVEKAGKLGHKKKMARC